MRKHLLRMSTLCLTLCCVIFAQAQKDNMGKAQVSMIQEKLLYSTDFSDWTKAAAAKEESTVAQSTKYSHEKLDFSIFNTAVEPAGVNPKFNNGNPLGWLMASKAADPYITTSALGSITKVCFVHAATGSKRGWKLEAKGDGDVDWVTLSDTPANPANRCEVTVEVNRTNCRLRFTNLNASQNAYLFGLDIYGNVDMSKSPALAGFKANGKSYIAADIFSETADGNMAATIELSKAEPKISVENPVSDLTADNGEIGDITYILEGDNTIVTIPVTANGATTNYIATFVPKKDFTLTYYNADGNELGIQMVEKDSKIGAFKYEAADLNIPVGKVFRGWFVNASGSGNRKYTPDETITGNTALYAIVNDKEVQSTTARYTFNLTDQYFYDEDHEAFNCIGQGGYHDNQHGWLFKSGDDIELLVGGNAYIILSSCKYGGAGTLTLKDSKGNIIGTASYPAAKDGESVSFHYEGGADVLHLTFDCSPYIHSLTIANVQDNPIDKNEAGYFIVKAGDAAHLLNTLMIANAEAKEDSRTYIFVPDGTYDLGETVLTPISGNNISLIGQSEEGTLIKNAPRVENEGIGTTALFLVTGSNTYFQDLSLQNAMPYDMNKAAGRAVVIQDKGNRTICKNVRLLSYQDTYYSNNNKGQFYFEDGEIHGVVDYVCGGGDVFYNRVKFVNESRSATPKTGSVTIAAPYTDGTQWGYVMSGCTIENRAKSFNFGRAWGGTPRLAWLNTTINQPAEVESTRFTTGGMNTYADKFVEYNSVDASGKVVSPASNTLTFKKDNKSKTYETILTAGEAAEYAIDKVFTDWRPEMLAGQMNIANAQISAGSDIFSWDAVEGATAYAVFNHDKLVTITTSTDYKLTEAGNYSVRAANSMGGFGKPSTVTTGIGKVASKDAKAIRIEYFTIGGAKVSTPQQGVNIAVKTFADGSRSCAKVIGK